MTPGAHVHNFFKTVQTQRDDDHRYYHHSRINQALHLLSACTFVCAYVLLFIDPAAAALLAWLVAMTSRQAGHFFFEPKGYDHVNQATHAYKEDIKVGYNLRRKVVLMLLWVAVPVLLWVETDLFGLITPASSIEGWLHRVGMAWLALGVAALLMRTVHLFFLQGVTAGLAWMTKILTDPFHDIKLYHKSPVYLLQGQLIDPMGRH